MYLESVGKYTIQYNTIAVISKSPNDRCCGSGRSSAQTSGADGVSVDCGVTGVTEL